MNFETNMSMSSIKDIRNQTHGSKLHSTEYLNPVTQPIPPQLFHCPICKSILKQVHVTPCGHSFCFECIKKHLQIQQNCPMCEKWLQLSETHPNYLLNELLSNTQELESQQSSLFYQNQFSSDVQSLIMRYGNSISSQDFEKAVQLIHDKQQQINQINQQTQLMLMYFFLQHARKEKRQQIQNLQSQLKQVSNDILCLARQSAEKVPCFQDMSENGPDVELLQPTTEPWKQQQQQDQQLSQQQQLCRMDLFEGSSKNPAQQSSCSNKSTQEKVLNESLPEIQSNKIISEKKMRVIQRFDDLMNCYLSLQSQTNAESEQPSTKDQQYLNEQPGTLHCQTSRLRVFQDTLTVLTSYTGFNVVSSFEHKPGNWSQSQNGIISAIEFCANKQNFASAGIQQQIDLYDFCEVVKYDGQGLHATVNSLKTQSKTSSLSWSPVQTCTLMSGGYDGRVSIWDMEYGEVVNNFEAHQKRIWSVEFAINDPSLYLSGSDDGTVKIWQLADNRSVVSIEVGSNVCSAKFNPQNSFIIAVGSAASTLGIYDMRNYNTPMMLLKGHTKSISYVSFMSTSKLLSASIDGSIKLWDLKSECCERTFTGHVNNRNFVGLSSCNQMIACGSENNTIHLYYEYLEKSVVKHTFPSQMEKHGQDFISSVTFKPESNFLVAANSRGLVQILEIK